MGSSYLHLKAAIASAPVGSICIFRRGIYFISHLVIFMPFQRLQWSHVVYNVILGTDSPGLNSSYILGLNDCRFDNSIYRMEGTSFYSSAVQVSRVHSGDWPTWSKKTEHTWVASLVNCSAQLVRRSRTCRELFDQLQQILYHKHDKSHSKLNHYSKIRKFLLKVMVATCTSKIVWRGHSLKQDQGM